jgi:hypothetical protein
MKKRSVILDTDPEVERMMIELARATPVWKKFEQVSDMGEACRQMAMIGLKERYPQASDEELRLRLAALTLDRETMIKVYGWDPEVEGY